MRLHTIPAAYRCPATALSVHLSRATQSRFELQPPTNAIRQWPGGPAPLACGVGMHCDLEFQPLLGSLRLFHLRFVHPGSSIDSGGGESRTALRCTHLSSCQSGNDNTGEPIRRLCLASVCPACPRQNGSRRYPRLDTLSVPCDFLYPDPGVCRSAAWLHGGPGRSPLLRCPHLENTSLRGRCSGLPSAFPSCLRGWSAVTAKTRVHGSYRCDREWDPHRAQALSACRQSGPGALQAPRRCAWNIRRTWTARHK